MGKLADADVDFVLGALPLNIFLSSYLSGQHPLHAMLNLWCIMRAKTCSNFFLRGNIDFFSPLCCSYSQNFQYLYDLEIPVSGLV